MPIARPLAAPFGEEATKTSCIPRPSPAPGSTTSSRRGTPMPPGATGPEDVLGPPLEVGKWCSQRQYVADRGVSGGRQKATAAMSDKPPESKGVEMSLDLHLPLRARAHHRAFPPVG